METLLRKHLCQNHVDVLLREGDGKREVLSVLRHRGQVGFELAELLGQLARAIGAEVQEDRRVLRRVEAGAAVETDRDDELVRHAFVIALPHRGDGYVCVGSHRCRWTPV